MLQNCSCPRGMGRGRDCRFLSEFVPLPFATVNVTQMCFATKDMLKKPNCPRRPSIRQVFSHVLQVSQWQRGRKRACFPIFCGFPCAMWTFPAVDRVGTVRLSGLSDVTRDWHCTTRNCDHLFDHSGGHVRDDRPTAELRHAFSSLSPC